METLNNLKDSLIKMGKEAKSLKREMGNKQRAYNKKQSEIKMLKQKIEDFGGELSIKVTDHAVTRYLERILGMSIESIKTEIVTDELCEQVKTLGDGEYPVKSFLVVIKDHTVITVKHNKRIKP